MIVKIIEIRSFWLKSLKTKLHFFLSSIFFLTAFIPSFLILILSFFFIEFQLNNWFGRPVQNVFHNAEKIGESYLKEYRKTIDSYVLRLVMILRPQMSYLMDHTSQFHQMINDASDELNLDEILIFNDDKQVVCKSALTFSLAFEKILDSDFKKAQKGSIVTFDHKDRVRALVLLDPVTKTYLFIGKVIDPKLLGYLKQTQWSSQSYQHLLDQHDRMKIFFISYFILLSLVILTYSMWWALRLGNRLFHPISNLIDAATQISHGELNILVPEMNTKTEFDDLVVSFNQMTTQLRKQKKDLIYSQKKATWSDIARKIAHEIKNPLTPIQLSAERLKRKFLKYIHDGDVDVFNNTIDTIIRQVGTIERLVSEFSNFARLPEPIMHLHEIAPIIQNHVNLQKIAFPEIDFKLQLDVDPDVKILCDEGQIGQVILNLVQNAAQALSESHTQNPWIHMNITSKGLSIEDNGPGFPEHILQNIFEPYFTTRKNGTGLGLALSGKIIKDHGWSIHCHNKKNEPGTQILITW
jgi:two-component system nitrogen regulation sensor histidine kinase NtrY